MDIKRAVLWMIFIFSSFMIWNNWMLYSNPPPEETTEHTQLEQSKDSSKKDTSVPSTVDDSQQQSAQTPADNANSDSQEQSETVNIKTNVFDLTFDTLGAQVISASIVTNPDATDETRTQLLTNKNQTYTTQSGLAASPNSGKKFPDQNTQFKLVSDQKELNDDGTLDVVFEAESDQIKVTRTYTFHQNTYRIDVKDDIKNNSEEEQSFSQYYQITRDNHEPEGSSFFQRSFDGFALYTDEGRFQKITFADVDKDKAKYNNQSEDGWISFLQHFFVTAWVPEEGSKRYLNVRKINDDLYALSSIGTLTKIQANETISKKATLWVGPQNQKSLSKIDSTLPLVVDYGWTTLIAKPMFKFMTWLHSYIGNWGWTIVALTVLIKLLLYPLSAASYRSMAKMKNAAPRMKALKEKYGDDRQGLNAAMMEMYRNEKINPLGGCFPILLQIPIFLSLYRVILASVEIRGAPWIGWITDLSVADPYYILPVIMVATMYIQFKLNPTPPDPTQARIMMMMPLVFGAMMFMFPAGLVLYWVVNNILSVIQQQWITRRLNRAANDDIMTRN